ncbi:MAG: potassium channel family protein [Dehalococcoidia bacterium]|nr:potassium channel family protein [Dehalococcoidia bacterium]
MDIISKLFKTDAEEREAIVDKLERITEIPLMVLAFLMVPLLLAPIYWDLTPEGESLVVTLDVLIWAIFAVDLALKTAIAPRRLAYLREHWLEVLVVLIPFARPLRIVRIIVYGSRAYRGAVRLARVDFLVAYAVGLVVLVAAIVTSVERGHESRLDSFPDALWWAVVTVTTVGYGDIVPVTEAGRALALVLMIGGVALFGALTANLASTFMWRETSNSTVVASLVEEVRLMRDEVARLRGEGPTNSPSH